jgi:ribose transport system permease protein
MEIYERLKSLAARSIPRLNGKSQGFSSSGLVRIAVLVVLFTVFSLFADNFFTVRNIPNLLLQTSPFALLAIGETVVLMVGGIDFSIGAMFVFGGAFILLFNGLGMSNLETIIDTCLLCGVFGLVNGLLVAKLHLPSFLVTIAMAIAIPGIAEEIKNVMVALNGPGILVYQYMPELPTLFTVITHDVTGAQIVLFPGISSIVIITFIVAVVAHLLLSKTRFGRYVYLVGNNSTAAHLSGINATRIKIMAFVFSSVMAGLTGVLLTSRVGGPMGGDPTGYGYEMTAIECAMIGGAAYGGGAGSIMATVVGSLIVGILTMGLDMMNVEHLHLPLFINALILVGAVYLSQRQNKKQA